MPAPTTSAINSIRTQLNMLDKGLTTLKTSEWMVQPEFQDMYSSVEGHYNQIKLSHLTGMEKDLMEQAKQDTKFYFILTKMLTELQCHSPSDQEKHINQVYNWYLSNSHVLHSKPRFGRARRKAEKALKSAKMPKRPLDVESEESSNISLEDLKSLPDLDSQDNSFTEITVEGPTPNKGMDSPEPTRTSTPHSGSTKTDPNTGDMGRPGSTETNKLDHLLPKRRTLPLAHVYNPLVQAFDEIYAAHAEQMQDEVKVRRSKDGRLNSGQKKAMLLRKWEAFQQKYTAGQQELSEMQHVGRSGVPGVVRYTAHDRGLMGEHLTQAVIEAYNMDATNLHPNQEPLTNQFVGQKLEDFYQSTEVFSPQKQQNYFGMKSRMSSARSSRVGSATPSKRALSAASSGKTSGVASMPPGGSRVSSSVSRSPASRVTSAVSHSPASRVTSAVSHSPASRVTSAVSHSPASRVTSAVSKAETYDSGVPLDAVISMLDSVKDEMAFHKEKLVPDPQPGFKQPTLTFDPKTRPQTAPPGGLSVQPKSRSDVNASMSSSGRLGPYMGQNLPPGGPQDGSSTLPVLPPPIPIRENIDWRGKVTPGTARSKWSREFKKHSYVSKTPRSRSGVSSREDSRPTSSLKQPQSGMSRPKTAPDLLRSVKWAQDHTDVVEQNERAADQAASHVTMEVDPEVTNDLVKVLYLGGSSKRKRRSVHSSVGFSLFSYFLTESGRQVPVDPEEFKMEYLTFCTSLSRNAHIAGGGRETKQSFADSALATESYLHAYTASTLGDFGMSMSAATSVPMDELMRADDDSMDMGGSAADMENHDLDSDLDILSSQSEEEEKEALDLPVKISESQRLIDEVNKLLGRPTLKKKERLRRRREEEERRENLLRQALEKDEESNIEEDESWLIDREDESASLSTIKNTLGVHFEDEVGGIDVSDWINKPPSGPAGSVYVSRPEHWLELNDDELLDAEIENYLQELANKKTQQVVRCDQRLATAYKQRIYSRTKLRGSEHNVQPKEKGSLSIEGITNRGRMRSAGTVPPRAKSSGPLTMLIKQKDMLRKAPVSALRTAPSIPTPHSAYGTRSPRQGQQYSSEHEVHARRQNSPRKYMETVGDMRTSDSHVSLGGPASEADGGFLMGSLRVARMRRHQTLTPRSALGGSVSNASDQPYSQGHPGTPETSISGASPDPYKAMEMMALNNMVDSSLEPKVESAENIEKEEIMPSEAQVQENSAQEAMPPGEEILPSAKETSPLENTVVVPPGEDLNAFNEETVCHDQDLEPSGEKTEENAGNEDKEMLPSDDSCQMDSLKEKDKTNVDATKRDENEGDLEKVTQSSKISTSEQNDIKDDPKQCSTTAENLKEKSKEKTSVVRSQRPQSSQKRKSSASTKANTDTRPHSASSLPRSSGTSSRGSKVKINTQPKSSGRRESRAQSAGGKLSGSKNIHPPSRASTPSKKLAGIGRPIPHYGAVMDPKDEALAVEKQKEAAAAVDIQRIFRGYIVRNNLKFLDKKERESQEDERKSLLEQQKMHKDHVARTKAIYSRESSQEMSNWALEYQKIRAERAQERQSKAMATTHTNTLNYLKADAKLSVIGPHVEVYEPFHPKKTGPDKALLNLAATIIQRHVRGYLIRTQFERVRRKAKYHASSWQKFISQYKELLRRIQGRHGIDRPKAPFSIADVTEYMDLKKRYESVYEKRAFGGELEHQELTAYFHECDLYPAQSDIDDAIDLILRGPNRKSGRGIHKHEVMELTFHLYPPKGTGIVNIRKSTWMNPIIDGEEAIKLIGTDNVEETTFKACWDLVSATHKARKASEQKAKRAAEEEKEKIYEEKRKAQQAEMRAAKRKEEKEKKELSKENVEEKKVEFHGTQE